MSVIVKIGTTKFQVHGGAIPDGYVEYIGDIIYDPNDSQEVLMVWDTDNIRPMNAAELLARAKIAKIAELKEEAEARTRIATGWDFPNMSDLYNYASELITTIRSGMTPAAKQAMIVEPRLQNMLDHKTAFADAKVIIEGYTLESQVLAYDEVNTPTWP